MSNLGVNKLQKYIDDIHGSSIRAFSRCIGVSHATLHHWFNGRNLPSRKTVEKIKSATNGYIQPSDWHKTL